MRSLFFSVLCALTIPLSAHAQDIISYEYDGGFDDAQLSLTTAIEAFGLKVDHISKVSDMLERTAEAVGATERVYEKAQIYQFCSASLSRKMMEENPQNLAYCPYQIFIYQELESETSQIGFRSFPQTEMQEVESLLNEIIEEAIAF